MAASEELGSIMEDSEIILERRERNTSDVVEEVGSVFVRFVSKNSFSKVLLITNNRVQRSNLPAAVPVAHNARESLKGQSLEKCLDALVKEMIYAVVLIAPAELLRNPVRIRYD